MHLSKLCYQPTPVRHSRPLRASVTRGDCTDCPAPGSAAAGAVVRHGLPTRAGRGIRERAALRQSPVAPAPLARFIAPKGSVALDGVSLTVNEVDGATFAVLIIPHTLRVTTLGALRFGDRINLEVDQMARYAARLMEGR